MPSNRVSTSQKNPGGYLSHPLTYSWVFRLFRMISI